MGNNKIDLAILAKRIELLEMQFKEMRTIEPHAINERLITDCGNVPLKDIDLEFHSRLLKIAGNPLVEKIGDMVYRLFESAIEKSVAESPDTAYQNHKKMLEALRSRDKEAMGSAVSGSLSIWEKSIPNKEKK